MSDSQEKSDDLIAELAKLMANNAGGAEPGPKPSVIKLPPLNDATIKAAPVRIPGMEAARPAPTESARPAPATMGAAPTIRIPGMEKPAGIDAVPAPQPRPTTQFDFGKAPAPVAMPKPEPMSNWQTSAPPKLPPPPPPRPAAVTQLAEMKFDQVKPATADAPKPAAPTFPRAESRVSAPPAPAPTPAPQAPVAAKPASPDSFGFDFGFSGGGAGSQPRSNAAPANDPIADLIAADLDSPPEDDFEDAAPAAPAAPRSPAPAPAPAHVATKPMPATVANEVLPNPIAPRPMPAVEARPGAASPLQVKPVTIAPRPSQGDRFAVTPTFNNPRPAQVSAPAAAPALSAPRSRSADLDPMDEIENLIGEAVRVELSSADKPVAPAVNFGGHQAPVVPPLNSGFAPRRANMRDREPQVDSAEAAILAAAAASGADVDRVEGEDRPYKRMKVKPPKTSLVPSGTRQYVGFAVAGTLLLAAGLGLFWVINMGREDPATAPVLTADAGVVKVQPAPAAPTDSTQSGSVVFNEINGTASVDNGETLVSRDETAGTSPTDVARAVVAEATDASESGLANRKVRTVTVRPDGTIVSGDEAVAGAEELPVERPNVPPIAGSELAPSELLTAVTATQDAAAGAASQVEAVTALVEPTGQATTSPLETPAPLAVATTGTTPPTFDASIVAPVPMPRPMSRGTGFSGGSSQQTAAVSNSAIAPAATPLVAVQQQQPTPAAVSSGGGAYVQLSSQPSEADASRQLRATQQRMSGMLNGAQLEIRRVDLGSKGVWYRIVLPTNSFRDATQTCASIKSNGGDCVAING
jgi:hypothetical protein